MSFSYAKFIARRGGVVLASGPPVESVPGPTRCCRDHSLQTWRSLKHEVNTIRCVLFMFSAIRRYSTDKEKMLGYCCGAVASALCAAWMAECHAPFLAPRMIHTTLRKGRQCRFSEI